MGWHWIDPLSPEFTGQPFSKTYIYGYYGGELSFVEPMITLAYSIEFDDTKGTARVTLENFIRFR